ncbi:variable surface protein Vir35 [Plasmodium vivax Mauritania I]|uniref:Variable surface protein Vir35 n=1 Tax=Plasmodium vivax Mauritania I TaxID=1035515 RepID=A0A0J9TG35_PLAVI|nr:variable surface protein Vir35 [Plasmodium vivax Mauritania I]
MQKGIKLLFFIQIASLILLSWMYNCNDGVHKICRTFGIKAARILAKDEMERKIVLGVSRGNASNSVGNNKLQNEKKDTSINENLKESQFNSLSAYRQNSKRRYHKLKGLKKKDCYYEQKIFNEIDKVRKLAKNMKNDEKKFKKIICKKYCYPIIYGCLFSLIGVIVPILAEAQVPSSFEGNAKDILPYLIPALNGIIFIPFCIISILCIIYILMKIVKYERLNEGKGKLKGKEYVRFCKEVFNIN